MQIIDEISLRDFKFWGGAVDRAKYLTPVELDIIEDVLEDMYPDGLTATKINDMFWFEKDLIARCLGYDSFKEIEHRDDEGEE